MYTVLIIEDSVELAEIIQASLHDMELETFHETHGQNGLETFKDILPDLVLLDIALPDIKGWKILDEIRALVQEYPEVHMPKVIVITAYGDPANRLMGKLQDVNRYLIKPFTPDEVEDVVSTVLYSDDDELPVEIHDIDEEEISSVLKMIENSDAHSPPSDETPE